MYTVMLIDDDYLSILKMEKIFQWNKYNFKHIYSATDSQDALHQLARLKPDVVFTDIKMCEVDGFDIIEFAKKRNLNSIFVIVSGYDDFTYVQKALRQGVVDYLLKPITPEDGENVLQTLKNIFDQQNPTHSQSLIPTTRFHISNKNFASLIDYIDHNYIECMNLSKLANMFNLNLSYCCQLFRKYLNCSFSEYINLLKLKKAVELLSESNMNIKDIAESLNYDYSYFCKIFKKQFGITPHLYKKLYGYREIKNEQTKKED